MVWVGCIDCEKLQNDFMAQTCALIAPVQPICTKFRVVMKHCQMHPNTTRRTKIWVYGPMGWIGCVRCEKFRCDFMARTCAWIVPVQPILHRVSCSNEILPNTPKHYEPHKNLSLGLNGVDWVRSLWKSLMRLHGTNFCINCSCSTCLHRVSCSNETLPNAPKYYETHQNMSLGSNVVVRVRSLWKFWCDFVAKTFALIAPVQPVLHQTSCSNETIQNAPKHYET